METRPHIVRVLALTVLLGLAAQIASAQTAIITGTVRDRSGAALPNVEIEILETASAPASRGATATAASKSGRPPSCRRPTCSASPLPALPPDGRAVPHRGRPAAPIRRRFRSRGQVVIRGQTAKPRTAATLTATTTAGPQVRGARSVRHPGLLRDRSSPGARSSRSTSLASATRRATASRTGSRRLPRDHKMGSIERPSIWTCG